ncbi:hypothetical protein C2857_001906 [Epichloe festucae Fl1]|uniref:Uncharacterized protein n=1 Tax=Epichloe festucae (strain Fl1) TaxID=877507 RepID=A0A7U3SN96_EPIFF|nr:hypothetical protein C2857_001906 [Epichloe festucae Fl1]
MDSLQKKGPWTKHEDDILIQLVQTHGPVNWVDTAAVLGTRSAKQCRERWTQTLNPELNREPITEAEGKEIERLVNEIGHRWAEIARRMNRRSDNAVKNWWNGRQNRMKRKERSRAIGLLTTSHEDIPGAPSTMANATFPLPEVACSAISNRPPTTSHEDFFGAPSNMARATLAFPQVACSATSLNSVSGQYTATWRETPLLSPCFSELAESDSGSNYTTSPADLQSYPHHIELPPLRDWPRKSAVESQLPSVHESSLGAFNHENQLPPLRSQSQLLTAPSSPIQQQQQRQQQQQHSQKPRSADDEATSSDVARHKMKLASLLA